MAEALIIEFEGIGRGTYDAVGGRLGVDPADHATWPDGLLFHAGAVTAGGFAVFEIWTDRDAQHAFMEGRLQPALAAEGVTGPPARAEWMELAGYVNLE